MGAVACGRLVQDDPIHTIDIQQHQQQKQQKKELKNKTSHQEHLSKDSDDGHHTYHVNHQTRTKRGSSSSVVTPPSSHDDPTITSTTSTPTKQSKQTTTNTTNNTNTTNTTTTTDKKDTTNTTNTAATVTATATRHRHARSMYMSDREPRSGGTLSVPVSPENRMRSLTTNQQTHQQQQHQAYMSSSGEFPSRANRMTSPRTALALMRMSSPRSSIGSAPSSMFSFYMSDSALASGNASPLMIASVATSPIASPISIHRRLSPSSNDHPTTATTLTIPQELQGPILMDMYTSRDSPIIHLEEPEPIVVVPAADNLLDLIGMNLKVDIDAVIGQGESPFFS